MEECRHFTNGKCTNPDGGGVCYCGCPLHKKSGVRDNGAQQRKCDIKTITRCANVV